LKSLISNLNPAGRQRHAAWTPQRGVPAYISSARVTILTLAVAILLSQTSVPASEAWTLETARAAATNGDPAAEFFLAKCYADGKGVARNYSNAVEYLRQSAGRGYAPAQTGLGSCYAHGLGVKQDYAEAVRWYRQAAGHGDALAQYGLGCALAGGKGAPKDINAAVDWWQKAAEQGQADAENALGQFYFHGEDARDTAHINYAASARWLRKAAEQGCPAAMNTMGFLYEHGDGFGQDWDEAVKWYGRAAQLGNAAAEDNLGLMYEEGHGGLPRDEVQAYKWFLLSEQQGNPEGQHDATEFALYHALTPQQFAEAKRLAAAFRPQPGTQPPANVTQSKSGAGG
jgi:uncharacterized protein